MLIRNIVLIFSLLLIGCVTTNQNISYNHEFRYLDLDNKIEGIIREYRKKYGKNTTVLLAFKNKVNSKHNEFYVKRISEMYSIYNYYISYHSYVDNVPVIISSKKDGYIDPSKYPQKFILELANYVNDDMLMNYIKKDSLSSRVFEMEYNSVPGIDHSEVWKIKQWKIYKNWKKHPVREKVLIENEKINLFDFYRVIKGGVDERKKGK